MPPGPVPTSTDTRRDGCGKLPRVEPETAIPESQSRRLAAILAADIAGYSALMGADEARTVRDLKGHQAVVFPLVSQFGGRMLITIALSTWIGLGVTALVLWWPDRKSDARNAP